MLSPGFRELTIIITIVFVTHPSCGFTLNRQRTAEADLAATTENLVVLESVQINSVKGLNDIKQDKETNIYNKAMKHKHKFSSAIKARDLTEQTTVTTDDPKETESTTISDSNTTMQDFTAKNDNSTEMESAIAQGNQTQDLKTAADENTTASDNKKASQESEILENLTEYPSTIEPTNYIITTSMEEITQMKAEKLAQGAKPTGSIVNTDENITEKSTIIDQIAIDSETTVKIKEQNEDEITNVTTESSTEKNNTEIVIDDIELPATSQVSSEIITSSESPSNVPSLQATSEVLKSKLSEDSSKSASTLVEVKVTKDTAPITTEASWKKYTTIERKRVGSSEETSSSENKDLVKAESIGTTLQIPSLDILREDLLSNPYQLSTITDLPPGSVTTDAMPTLESIGNTQSETLGTVASKRGGFLDLSRGTSEQYNTNTDKNTEYKTMYEIEATDIESQEIKKLNGHESQSQLAEDAMQEELMKEEINKNRQENAKRYDDGKVDVKPLADETISTITTVSSINQSINISDDSLSVQPINQDRRTTLYTVGPNYKPMKRIDVQPAKQLVRDPDDNSWRNESISSLGIVFKPKNSSSKSFKEVLKTKTESELNNLQDKDNKGDTPELRVRLEKIAEDRKSRKKKIGKLGEIVYTDYEEGSSAEGTSTETIPTKSMTTVTPLNLASKELEIEVTSPMTTTERHNRYWKNQLEAVNKLEMLKDLGLDILTTVKTKKPYNIAEYYDTTDEYDADYVTYPNIDLKRFTMPFKTTYPLTSPPMPPPIIRFMSPQFPERKPTVQYFPPTTKPPKVNINEYDANFENKVKFYTLKEAQKTTPPFSNVASLQVVTDVSQIRPTVKDFTTILPRAHNVTNKQAYDSNVPLVKGPHNVVINDENINRGTYVIKHYKDFLNMAAKDEDDGPLDFVPYTVAPTKGVTLDDLTRSAEKDKSSEVDYDYETQFRKDVLHRFVDNFNQNSDRFKVDFPVLYNTSVFHRSNDDGRVLASSSTFVKRLYGTEPIATRPPIAPSHIPVNKGCEPNCENLTVELSPAYELHYYVPEQEERQEMEREQPATTLQQAPYRYKL